MSDEERTGNCVICAHRDAREGWICDPCRGRLAGQLRDIPHLVEELKSPPEAEPARDLVSVAFPAAAIAGQSNAPRVQGSREAPVPISVDRTDLLSDARVLNLTKAYDPQADVWRVPYPEDQIGHLSVAAILDGWCRDFAETRRETVPQPSVGMQCRYLGDRLDWAFTDHAAVDEFAGEVSDLWHVLRRACGLTMPQPELCIGIPCRRVDCDMKTLYRVPGSDYVECSSCGNLLTEDEYRAWVALSAAPYKTRKTA